MQCNINELEEMLICVKLLKMDAERNFDDDYARTFMPLSSDDIYEVYISVFDRISELACCGYDNFNNHYTHKFMSDAMTEYYHLAYEYGEFFCFSKDDNPYINSALNHLRNTVGSIDSYCYAYRLYHSKSRKVRFYFLTSEEHWMPYETISELCNFFDYFSEELPSLRKEVGMLKNPIKAVKPKRKRRKAA